MSDDRLIANNFFLQSSFKKGFSLRVVTSKKIILKVIIDVKVQISPSHQKMDIQPSLAGGA
jgi:hypothetical protein